MKRSATSMLMVLPLAVALLVQSKPIRALDCSKNDFELRPLGATTIEIALAWAAVPGATGYVVERAAQGSSTCSLAPLDASYTVEPFENAYGDTGRAPDASDHFFAPSALSAQSTYCYRVRAVLAGGERVSRCVENQRLLQTADARPRGAAGDLWADVVLGKPDFGQNSFSRTSENGYEGAGGILIDRTHTPNRVYIGDTNHNRIVGFDHLGQCDNGPTPGQNCTTDSECGTGGNCIIGFGRHCVNQQPQTQCVVDRDCTAATDICALDTGTVLPAVVIGQSSLRDQSACNQDGTGQVYPDRAPAGQGTLCLIDPTQVSITETVFAAHMAVDDQGSLYVADLFNHRVLKYNNPFVSSLADDVWGQADFSGNLCNRGASQPADNTLCFGPREHAGVAIDSTDGSLWVADTGNSRVLRFPKVNGVIRHDADLVLGQPSLLFTTNTLGGQVRGLDQFSYPIDVAFFNGKLYVADTVDPAYWGGSRVLEFAPPFNSGMTGSMLPISLPCNDDRRCDGNTQMACTTDANCQAQGACLGAGCCTTGTRPMDLAMDTKRNGLWVQNICGYSELLDLDTTPPTIVPGPVPSTGPLDFADGIDIDTDGNIFMVNKWGDTYRFKRQGLGVDNLGNPETVFAGGLEPSADSAYSIKGVTIYGNQLIVADRNRLLIWNDFLPDTLSIGRGNPLPLSNGQPADDQYGESSLTSAWHWTTHMFHSPQTSSGKLWVEQFNSWTNRLLVFNGPLSNGAPAPTVIPLTQQQENGSFGGFPVVGCPGAACCTCSAPGAACNSNNIFALEADDIDFSVSRSGNEVWVADRSASRVFRIVNIGSNPKVDVILGQSELGGTSCSSGPAGLCLPYHVTLDAQGNLYIGDNGGETGTNQRILEFDAGALPPAPAAQVTCGLAATRMLGATGPRISPFKPTLHPDGALLVANNPYSAPSSRYATVYLYPQAGWTPRPQLILGDMPSYPIGSQLFDNYGNLYLTDNDWSRVVIYKDPLRRLRFGPYRDTVVADVPAAYFRLGETAGPTAVDASGNNNNGTYSDTGIAYGADALIGFDGDTAITTDGAQGTMTVALPNQSAYTIEAWVKPEAGATTARNILTRTSGQGPTNQWSQQLRITTGGVFEHYLSDGQDRVVTGTTPVVAGTTYHVAGTAVNNGSMHLYVNGAEEGTPLSIGALWTQGNQYVLGSHAGPGGEFRYFKGSLDEVAIYDSALPPARIQAHYNAAVQSPPPTPTWTPVPTPLPNVAVGQRATQSSTFEGNDANRAVDGNTNGNLGAGSVSVTDNTPPQAWWQVDLGTVYSLTTIDVWNRTDCCSTRLANFYLFVSDVPFTSTDLATTRAQPGVSAYFTAGAADAVTTLAVNRTGRYVRVQLSGTDFLQLAEVEVFAIAARTPTPTQTPTPTATSGFVPPDANTGKCEDLVAAHLEKLSACMTKCQTKQAGAARKGQAFDEEACEQGIGRPVSCRMAYNNKTTKLLGRTPAICPACLNATAQSNLADLVVNFIKNNNGQIYCAGTTNLGGDDTGFVPPDANTGKCEDLVAKHLRTLSGCMTKCQIKQADAARKGKPFDEEACEQGIGRPVSCRTAYNNATTQLLGRTPATCPACLDATAQSHLADLVMSFIENNNGLIYCAGTVPLP